MSTDSSRSIRDQVWDAADPSGETRTLINAAMDTPSAPGWFSLLGVDIGEAWQEIGAAGVQYGALVESIEEALRTLVPRGWAVMTMNTEPLAEAVRLVRSDRGEDADLLLADQWDGDGAWRTKRVCDRVRVMGAGDPQLSRLFGERARLLRLAMDHHESGHYEASIPLLQAQLEGIVTDVVTGKKFFTKGPQKADLVDPQKLVSIEASLAALQATYGEDVKVTQAEGSLSRHGVAHGRELAYDTRVNSAKTWSVMDALVEWAMPRARAKVEARKTERQLVNAGSQDVGRDGRRIDDREFSETRDILRLLSNAAMGWHRQQARFRPDLVGGVYTPADFMKRRLPSDHGTQQHVTADGDEVVYWRETVSGWVLAITTTWKDGRYFEERVYAGPTAPSGPPSEAPAEWPEPGESVPDWP